MSTITQIVSRLKERLSSLPGVDKASIDSYLPPVETQQIALIIPPFRQETRVDVQTPTRAINIQSHRIPVEFWVKVNTGRLAYTLQRAREIGLEAIRLLMTDQTLGGVVSHIGNFGQGSNQKTLTADVADMPIEIAGVPYIVVTVMVPVIDYADA